MAKLTDQLMNEQEAKTFIARHFGKQADLLSELREYGLFLLSRCYLSKPVRTTRDFVALGVLLRQVIAMLDSVHILVKEGAVTASFPPARTLMEASIALQWVLGREGAEQFYFVWNLRQQLHASERGGADDDAAVKAREGIAGMLASDECRELNRAFDDLKERDPRRREPSWYEPSGAGSFVDLAEDAGRGDEYRAFLALYDTAVSGAVLGGRSGTAIPAALEPIRHPVRIIQVLPAVFGGVLASYRNVIELYRPGELNDFRLKSLMEWEPVFADLPAIQAGGGELEPGD